MEIYNSLQGNIFHIKEFIIHIKKTYDCPQRKNEIYNSLNTNIDYIKEFIVHIKKTYDCSQMNKYI